MKYAYLIIGADPYSAETIQACLDSLQHYFCVGIIDNDASSIEKLIKKQPHLVFLFFSPQAKDTEFSLDQVKELYQYMEVVPYFILVTTTPNFALQAIQSGISDYLLKPLNWHQLGKSLTKFKKRVPPVSVQSICIRLYSDYRFINYKDIVFLKADNNTTDFILENGKTVTAFKPLKHFEENLPYHFLRIHRSYIINFHFISRVYLSKSRCYLNDNMEVPFSVSYRVHIDYIIKKMKL